VVSEKIEMKKIVEEDDRWRKQRWQTLGDDNICHDKGITKYVFVIYGCDSVYILNYRLGHNNNFENWYLLIILQFSYGLTMINHCDRHITLLSDTDIYFETRNLSLV
jgi:hypothetical protein